MKTTVLYFSDGSSEEKNVLSFPDYFEVISINKENGNLIDLSIFRSVASFLKTPSNLKMITICFGISPKWDAYTWNEHLKQAKKEGSSIYHLYSQTSSESLQPYVATFNVSELRMALDQNYRPTFENIEEAYNTFGFRSSLFSPDNIVT